MSDFVSTVQYQVIWPDSGATTYTINSASNAAHLSLDGAGIPNMLRTYRDYAQSDGGVDQGFRLDVRHMIWRLLIEGTSEYDLDNKRAALWGIFRPLDDPLKLKVTKANGEVRQIDCYVEGAIEVTPGPGYMARVTVPLIAPDPLWYDPVQQVQEFPLPDTSFDVDYDGLWYEWPIVKIYGQVQDLLLTTTVTIGSGQRTGNIDFSGHTVPVGAIYTCDLRPGRKTIVDASSVNKLGNLATFGLLPEFRLWPEPLESSGTNTIAASHGATDASAKVVFEFYNRYIAL